VLKSDGSIARGWVVVKAGQIVSVRSTKPRDVEHAISTGGVILAGLIDLHGHPEYNVFAAWEPPKVYINRGRWRDSDEYDQLIKKPGRL
jgi:5-methylthioadenosine/S-adenosylhomocysteine deaminase